MAEAFLRGNETLKQLQARCSNMSSFSCSELEWLALSMGPQRLPLSQTLPYSVLLLLLFSSGVAGNVLMCLLVVSHAALHTVTNYYLFNLALSDLLLLLFGIPNDVVVFWHQYPYVLGDVFCKLRAFISEAANYASVLTILAFSLERYLAICHPLHMYAMSGLQRALRIISALWLVALLSALPFGYYTDVNYHEYPPNSGNKSLQSAFCAMLEMPSWYLCELSSFFFFLLPGLLILFLYIRMGLQIRSSSIVQPGSSRSLNGVKGSVHGTRHAASRKNVLRMLAAVVIAFFVCWAPFHLQRLFFIYGVHSEHYYVINEWLFTITGFFYYISATVNPILYNIMSRRYRKAFRDTLCCWPQKKSKRYREQSSFRETSVHHIPDGTTLVRVRSCRQEATNRINCRRNNYEASDTIFLCNDNRNEKTEKTPLNHFKELNHINYDVG